MTVSRIRLGKSDVEVSVVGIGTWQASGTQWGTDVTDENCVQAIVRSAELGVNLVDTAEAYGNGHSEEVVGRAVREVGRERVVVATKVHGGHLRYDDVVRACDMSLSRLGVKQIDLYQVHWPDPWQQIPLRNTMRAMEKLHEEGKIRAIGVSNFAVRDLEEARSVLSHTDVVSNQVRYSILQRQIEEEVVPYCKRESVTVLAYSPLAQGALSGKYTEDSKPSDDVRKGNKLFSDRNMVEVSKVIGVLADVASRRGKTIPQVALNWIISHPGTVPIPGAKRAEQAEENAGAAGWTLSPQEIKEIDAIYSSISLDYF